MSVRTFTRRDFFWALVPAWFTVRNFKAALLGITVLFLANAVVMEAKSARLWTNLRGLGILCAIGLVLWLVARLVAAFKDCSQGFPPALAALVAVLGQLINFAASAVCGAYLYVRWKNGDDPVGVAISLGVFAIVHFRDEWQKRSKAKSPASDSRAVPD